MNQLNAVGQANGQLSTRRPRCIETDASVYRIGYRELTLRQAQGRQAEKKRGREQVTAGRLFRGWGAALEVLDGLGVRCAPFFDSGGVAFVLLETEPVCFAHLRDLFLDVRVPLDRAELLIVLASGQQESQTQEHTYAKGGLLHRRGGAFWRISFIIWSSSCSSLLVLRMSMSMS